MKKRNLVILTLIVAIIAEFIPYEFSAAVTVFVLSLCVIGAIIVILLYYSKESKYRTGKQFLRDISKILIIFSEFAIFIPISCWRLIDLVILGHPSAFLVFKNSIILAVVLLCIIWGPITFFVHLIDNT